METKTCNHCKKILPLDAFQKRAASRDGLTASCKACLKERDAAKHKKYRDKRLAQMRLYAQTEKGKQSHGNSTKKWLSLNPTKRRAHNLVNNAVRDKRLFPEPCEVCGSTESVHAHHDDYAKPLNVRWLCAAHHRQWHIENGEGLNP